MRCLFSLPIPVYQTPPETTYLETSKENRPYDEFTKIATKHLTKT